MRQSIIKVTFLIVMLTVSAGLAAANELPEPVQQIASLYNTLPEIEEKFFTLHDDLMSLSERAEEQKMSSHAGALNRYRLDLILGSGDTDMVFEYREDHPGEELPLDLAPIFSQDQMAALEQLDTGELLTAVWKYLEENDGDPFFVTYFDELLFSVRMNTLFRVFQQLLNSYNQAAPEAEKYVAEYNASPDTEYDAAAVATALVLVSSGLAQNSRVIDYHKKYRELFKRIDDFDIVEELYGRLVRAYIVAGDYEEAERLVDEMNALVEKNAESELMEKSAPIAERLPLDGDIDEEYSIMAEYVDPDMDDDGGAAEAPEYNEVRVTVNNISSVQYELLRMRLFELMEYQYSDEESFEKNTAHFTMYLDGADTADVAAFLDGLQGEGFVLRVDASDDETVTASALGVPKQQFNVMLPVFEIINRPRNDGEFIAEQATAVLAVFDAAAQDAGDGFQHALFMNFNFALKRAAGDASAFAGDLSAQLDLVGAFPLLTALAHTQWGLARADAGAYGDALDSFNNAAALLAQREAPPALSRPVRANILAADLASSNVTDTAPGIEELQALIAASQDDLETLNLEITLANYLYAAAEYEKAEQALDRARELSRNFTGLEKVRALILLGLGNCRIMTMKHAEALEAFAEAAQAATAANDPLLAAAATAHQARVQLFLGDYQKAEDGARAALALADQFEDDELKWQALFTQARALEGRDQFDAALDTYLLALDVIENADSADASAVAPESLDRDDVFRYAAALCARTDRTEVALQIIERGKALDLRRQYENSAVAFRDPKTRESAQEIKDLKSRISGLKNQIQKTAGKSRTDQLVEEVADLKTRLQDSQRSFIKYINGLEADNSKLASLYKIEPVELVRVREKLPPDMAVLYFLLGDDVLYIFHVRRDGIGFKEVPVKTNTFHNLVKLFRNNVSNPATASRMGAIDPETFTAKNEEFAKRVDRLRDISGRLYDSLIAPILPELEGVTTLGIIPNGVLNFVPYQALMPTDGSARFLIDKYAIFYLDTLSVLQKPAPESRPAGMSLYAFGNADQTLPAAEQEVRAISSIFPASDVFIGPTATEDRAKKLSESKGIFHFATHGILDFNEISKSYIVLAPDPEYHDDGRFTIEEVWGYWWGDAALVSLSACNTANGDITVRGKAVHPASAFLNAGAPTVLATLWSVDDEATARLMTGFYKHFADMEKVQALRTAQLELMKDPRTVHPFYWAPFTLIGDWR